MNVKPFLFKSTIAMLLFLAVIFGVESFLDSRIGEEFAFTQHSLFWLFIGLYWLMWGFISSLRSATLFPGLSAHGLIWGIRLVQCWLTLALLVCIVLRLDFSSGGLLRALVFFLIPGEVVYYFPVLASLASLSLFLFTVSGMFIFIGGEAFRPFWRR